MALLDPRLKEMLICPVCHGELDEDEANAQLLCRSCGRAYPVRDFPIMMPNAVEEESGESSELTTDDATTNGDTSG